MAIVSLAIGKGELDIEDSDTSEDDRVQKAIDAAQGYVEGYCDRKFEEDTYEHYFDGNDTRYLLLREFPVTAVADAWIDDDWVFADASKIAAAERKILQDVMLVRKCGIFQYTNALSVKVSYTAGYADADMPVDVVQATLEMMKFIYYTRNDRRMGLGSKTKLNESVSYETTVPPIVNALLEAHRRPTYLANRLSIFPPEMVKRLSEGGDGKG